jgi:histone H3/H4
MISEHQLKLQNELKLALYAEKDQEIESIMKTHTIAISKMESCELNKSTFPLTRMAKIIKSDQDVKMITKDFLLLMNKSCELFIQELVHCSWVHTEEQRRVTLQKNDLMTFIERSDPLDFLALIMREDYADEV